MFALKGTFCVAFLFLLRDVMTEPVVQMCSHGSPHDWFTYRYCVSEIPLWTRCARFYLLSDCSETFLHQAHSYEING